MTTLSNRPKLSGWFVNLSSVEQSTNYATADDIDDKNHERFYCMLTPPLLPFPIYAYAHCRHNEVVGLNNRVFARQTHTATNILIRFDMMYRTEVYARRLARYCGYVSNLSTDDLLVKYSGAKRQRYTDAFKFISENNYTSIKPSLGAFIKLEKMDKVTDPRFIQHRTDPFLVLMLQRTLPVEDRLLNLRGDGKNLPYGKLVAKHHNPKQRAKFLLEKHVWLSRKGKPWWFSCDMSRFDRLVREVHIRLEKTFFTMVNKDQQLKILYNMILSIMGCKGSTKTFLRYVALFNRFSGDPTTGGGNVLIVVCIVMVVMVDVLQIPIEEFTFYDDGDDCPIGVIETHKAIVMNAGQAAFARLGMDVKFENLTDSFERILFCQCRPVKLQHWMMIRNPSRIISRALIMLQDFESATNRLDYVHSVGMCELANNSGCPILQEYSKALLRNSQNGRLNARFLAQIRHTKGMDPWTAREQPVTEEARHSFRNSWGIDIGTQLEWESFLKNWTFDVHKDPCVKLEANVLPDSVAKWSTLNPFEEGYNLPLLNTN